MKPKIEFYIPTNIDNTLNLSDLLMVKRHVLEIRRVPLNKVIKKTVYPDLDVKKHLVLTF